MLERRGITNTQIFGIAGVGVALLLSSAATAQDRIVVAGRDGVYATGLRMMVQAYQVANPDVEIELLELPYANLYERAVIAMREDSGAYDVVLMDDTWATEFMSNGWLADLDALGGGADADFIAPTVAVSRYPHGEGTLYALPMVGNVALFAYRTDLFAEAGLTHPPANWDEVVAAAVVLDGVVDHGVVYRGQKANPIVTGFLPILWAHGARLVDDTGAAALDTPAAVGAVELYLRLRPSAPEDVVVYNSSEVRDALQSGRASGTGAAVAHRRYLQAVRQGLCHDRRRAGGHHRDHVAVRSAPRLSVQRDGAGIRRRRIDAGGVRPVGCALRLADAAPMTVKRAAGIAAFAAGLTAVLALMLAPVAWMIGTSFESPGAFTAPRLSLLPTEPTLTNYAEILDGGMLRRLLNSVAVTAGATVLALATGFLAAYGLARFRFPARLDLAFLALVLLIKLLPPIVVAVPMYQLLDRLGLIDTLTGLVLAYQVYCLPFAIWMLLGFVRDIPVEVEEAAAIDGAGQGRRLHDIVLPLMLPGLIATTVFTAILAWNEFLFALLFIQTPSNFPLPVYIATFITEDETLWGRLTAIGFLASVPIILALGYLQRHLLRGFLAR